MEKDGKFLSISIPSFAAQTNLHGLGASFADYRYKEAALNPTNPADRATDWEADLINDFRASGDTKQIVTERDTPTGNLIVVAHPLSVGDGSCLSCHGEPTAAPASMTKSFGVDNGFGWHVNEVIGAQIVSLPLAPVLAKANENLMIFLGLLTGVFLAMLIILNLLLHYLVIRPVKRISSIATEVSLGNNTAPEFTRKGSDEISILAVAFNRMRRSLASAMTILQDETT
jgi:protein-histidine pros-kinase